MRMSTSGPTRRERLADTRFVADAIVNGSTLCIHRIDCGTVRRAGIVWDVKVIFGAASPVEAFDEGGRFCERCWPVEDDEAAA